MKSILIFISIIALFNINLFKRLRNKKDDKFYSTMTCTDLINKDKFQTKTEDIKEYHDLQVKPENSILIINTSFFVIEKCVPKMQEFFNCRTPKDYNFDEKYYVCGNLFLNYYFTDLQIKGPKHKSIIIDFIIYYVERSKNDLKNDSIYKHFFDSFFFKGNIEVYDIDTEKNAEDKASLIKYFNSIKKFTNQKKIINERVRFYDKHGNLLNDKYSKK